MAARRDYAKRTTTRKKKPALPGWVWMLGGLLAGLFIAFLVYLQQAPANKPPTPQGKKPAQTVPAKPATSAKKTESKDKHGINFDFYRILPELEVVIPDIDLGGSEQEKATYYLQVGSFKSKEEAETRKAELLLLNFAPSIQTVTVDNSQTWHRVRLGPFKQRRKLDKARRRLQDNGIDFIMLKDKS